MILLFRTLDTVVNGYKTRVLKTFLFGTVLYLFHETQTVKFVEELSNIFSNIPLAEENQIF